MFLFLSCENSLASSGDTTFTRLVGESLVAIFTKLSYGESTCCNATLSKAWVATDASEINEVHGNVGVCGQGLALRVFLEFQLLGCGCLFFCIELVALKILYEDAGLDI
jgi:hypothetical protein